VDCLTCLLYCVKLNHNNYKRNVGEQNLGLY